MDRIQPLLKPLLGKVTGEHVVPGPLPRVQSRRDVHNHWRVHQSQVTAHLHCCRVSSAVIVGNRDLGGRFRDLLPNGLNLATFGALGLEELNDERLRPNTLVIGSFSDSLREFYRLYF